MPIQLSGNGGTVAEVDGTTWRAVRTNGRPVEYGTGGFYSVTMSGTTAAAPAAGGNLASFRWTSGSLIALIRYIEIHMQVSTASTAGLPELACYVARSFSVSDSAGTAVTLTGNAMKLRTSMSTSVVGDIRFATGGVLTAGTRTLDGQPIVIASTPLALGTADRATWDLNSPNDHPLVLVANEGLVFQNTTALTAGAYRYNIRIDWAEVPSY